MLASAFSAGTGGGGDVEKYLLEEEERLLLLKQHKDEILEEGFRLVEVIKGDMAITRDLIDSSHRRWTYTHGTIAFHPDDNPTDEQIEEIIQDFEDFMFAGKATDTFNITWVRHRDKPHPHVHFVVPRVDLETGQDLNIAPPGHEKDWGAWVASINDRYGFKDPFEQPTPLTKNLNLEHPKRKKDRENINAWVEQQVDAGNIESREHLIEVLGTVGEITRVNDNFISLKTEDAEKAFRLKGAIYELGFDFKISRSRSRALESERGKAGPSVRYSDEPASRRDEISDRRRTPIRSEQIERRRTGAFEYRRNFFEKLRERSRKVQNERGAERNPEPDLNLERGAGGTEIHRDGAGTGSKFIQNDTASRAGFGREVQGPDQTVRGSEKTLRGTEAMGLAGDGRDGDRSGSGGAGDGDGGRIQRHMGHAGLKEGHRGAGTGAGGAGEPKGDQHRPRGLSEGLRAENRALEGGASDVYLGKGETDEIRGVARDRWQPHQRLDSGVDHAADGPFKEAYRRLGSREREAAERSEGTRRAVRGYGRLFGEIDRLIQKSGRAIEQLGATLRNFIQSQVNRLEPKPELSPSKPRPPASSGYTR